MINNEDLFDHFRSSRRHGHRSGWAITARQTARVVSFYVPACHGMPEPSETLTEADMANDGGYANCGHCGEPDLSAMLVSGICQSCALLAYQDQQDTFAAVLREEHARL